MKKIISILLVLLPIFAISQVCCDLSKITVPSGSTPTINTSISTIPLFTTNTGTPSSPLTFSITGSSLIASVLLTAPTNFEISLDNINYALTKTVSQSGGVLVSSPVVIYVRAAGSAPIGSYINSITLTSSGAATKTVAVSATVNSLTPNVIVSINTLSGFSTTTGTPSSSQNYTVTGSNLTADITVTSPTDFEISVDNTTFTSSVVVNRSGSNASATVYVRITHSASVGNPSGSITNVSSGAVTQNVSVSGTVTASGPGVVAKFNFSKTNKVCSGWTNMFGDPLNNILSVTDIASGFTLTTIARTNHTSLGFDANGTQSGTYFSDCSGTVQAVMYNGFVCTDQYDHTKPQLQIGSLNTGKTYTIKLTGSTTGGVNRISDIRVEGSTLSSMQSYVSHSNTANGVIFTSISPDGSGTIRIWYNSDVTSPEQANVSAFTITEN